MPCRCLILPCPKAGQQSRTTTGPLRRAHLISPERVAERSTIRRMKIRMELTEALVTEDITPFERERLREALEDEVRRQLPTDRQLLRVVDCGSGGWPRSGKRSRHEEVQGRVRDGVPRLGATRAPSKLDVLNEIRASIRATPGWA